MRDGEFLRHDAGGEWWVDFTWAKGEEVPPKVETLRDAFLNDTPATLAGQECRVVKMDDAIEWNRRSVRFALQPV